MHTAELSAAIHVHVHMCTCMSVRTKFQPCMVGYNTKVPLGQENKVSLSPLREVPLYNVSQKLHVRTYMYICRYIHLLGYAMLPKLVAPLNAHIRT